MKRSLAGRVIAITGASSGIGAAVAVAAAGRGSRVALLARREALLDQVARQVEHAGGEAVVVVGDVRDPAISIALVQAATDRWGRLDVMLCNAGFGVAATVAETPEGEARELFDVNVLGSVWSVQAAWPVFAERRAGHMILVSSAAAFHGLPVNGLYSASKAAQRNLAEALRIEAGPIGVDVSVVYPIMTATGFSDAVRDHTGGRKKAAGSQGPRQAVEPVARRIVGCIERPRFEVYPYRAARIMPWLEAISPRFAARLLGFRSYHRRLTGDAT